MLYKLVIAFLVCSYSYSLSADDIMNKVFKANRVIKSKRLMKMKLVSNGVHNEREFLLYEKINNIIDSNSVIKFQKPNKYKNVSLLTKNDVDGNSSQWVYLPALKKVRRINSSNQSGRFVGSHLYYIDLQNRAPMKDKHKIVSSLKNNIVKIESIPKVSAVYDKVYSEIDIKKLIPIKVTYYRDGKKEKEMRVLKIVKHESIWTVDKFVVEEDEKNYTEITVLSRDLNNDFPDALMSQYSFKN